MSVSVEVPEVSICLHERKWPVLIAVWATFVLYSAVAAPVPGVNEPHYLSKSKHFWQPEWCEQDFFLASANAHTVFYATIGGLTRFASFEQAAWAGRLLSIFMLAWGWTHALAPLFFTRWAPLWTAWLFLGLASCGNFSGEWLVGGVEGKVPCYAFLLAAFGDVLRHRPLFAATWAGLAISFHPVVGIWGMMAFILSQATNLIWSTVHRKPLLLTPNLNLPEQWRAQVGNDELKGEKKSPHPASPRKAGASGNASRIREANLETRGEHFAFFVSAILPWFVLVLFALPGFIPVIRLLTDSASSETKYSAAYLQVYFRLAHHLDPMTFSTRSYFWYAVMLIVWLCSFWWGGQTISKQRFDRIVLWSVLFAVVGILIGWGPRPAKLMPLFGLRMQLLKFYPFRLADSLLPLAFAVSLLSVLERSLFPSRIFPCHRLRSIFVRPEILMLLVFLTGLWQAHATADSNRRSRETNTDWLDACAWIDNHLPASALVETPKNSWAFKWFAKRAEYVAYKDFPQDSKGIVEWNRRLNFRQKWFEENYSDKSYSAEELKDLRQQTGITHLLADHLGPLELVPIYQNESFRLYDLQTLD